MKKQHKIVSLLLVLSLLFSSFVFTVNADQASANSNDEGEFTPTATLTDITASGGSVSSHASYLLNGTGGEAYAYSWTFSSDDFSAHEVTLPDESNYMQLYTKKTGDTSKHTHFSSYAKNTVTYDANENQYVVFDFDIGTESSITKFMLGLLIRQNSTSGSWMSSGNNLFTVKFSVKPGNFTHITAICDYNNNMFYVYENNVLIISQTLMANLRSEFEAGSCSATAGIRIQADSTYGHTPLTEGETYLFDNFNVTSYKGSAAGNLADAIAKNDLSAWDNNNFNSSYELPVVPDIAEVDGVRYNSINDINNLLAAGTAKNVELLRDATTKFVVDCNATITTHGFSTYKLGTAATSVDNGNGTVTVTSEFRDALSITKYTDNTISNGTDFIGRTEGSFISGVSSANQTSFGFVDINNALPYGSNDNYLVISSNSDYTHKGTTGVPYINVAGTGETFNVIGDDVSAYYVIDFDMATHGDVFPAIDVSVVNRRASDEAGFPFSASMFIQDYVSNNDEWSHITLVGDVKSNVLKLYVNGVFVKDGGVAVDTSSDKLASDTSVIPKGFRLEIAWANSNVEFNLGDNIAFDNFSERIYANGNAGLTAAINAGDLSAWSGYTAGKSGEKLTSIATVNGTPYYNTNNLESALYSNNQLDVEFGTAPFIPVTIRANAVINTHGLDINSLITCGEGCEIVSTSGNYVTTTCEYLVNKTVESISYDSVSAAEAVIFNATKGTHPENLYNRFNPVSSGTWGTHGYRYGEIITNPFTGETIYHEAANVDEGATTTTGTNEYVNFFFNSVKLVYEEGKNDYVVMDFDMSYDGILDGKMSLGIIPRNSGGRWANSAGIRDLKGLVEGEMVHVTAVHDYVNNKAYYFFNGVLMNTVNGGAINDAGHTEYLGGATGITTAEYKLGSNSLDSVYIDNMIIRSFDLATAEDTIDDAVAAGDITKWTDNIYADGTHTELPAIANVGGVECSTVAKLNELITANPGVKVDILHNLEGTITIQGIATIDTHGLTCDFAATEGGTVTKEGNIIRIASSNVSSVVNGNETEITNAIKYNITGNLLTVADISDTGGDKLTDGTYSDKVPWGSEGGRGSSLVTDPDTGNVYFHEYVIGDPEDNYGDYTYAAGGNDFMNYTFTTQTIQYSADNREYIIVDYDVDYRHSGTAYLQQQVIVRNIGGTSWANVQYLKNFGLTSGEFCHVTAIYDYYNNYAHIFVNGKLTYSLKDGALSSACHTNYLGGTSGTASEFRVGSNTYDVTYTDNMCIRYEKNAVGSDTIATAINTGYLAAWSNNIYTEDYVLPKHAPIATVNGVDVYNENKLASMLTGRDSVEVEFWRSPSEVLEVTADAVVETHGFSNTVVAGTGASIEAEVDTVIYFNGVFKETASYVAGGDGTTAGSFTDHRDTSIPYNIYSTTAGEGNPSSFRYFKHTDYDTKNPYYMINPILDKSVKNTYVNVSMATNPLITATSYFIFDMDVATETEFIDKMAITIQQRSSFNVNNGSTDFTKTGDTLGVEFDNYLVPSDEWAHLTIIGDIADNKQYIFINGQLVDTVAMITNANYNLDSHIAAGDFKCTGTRINMGASVVMDQTATTLFDSVSMRYYNSNAAAADVEAAIAAGTLQNYALAEYGRMGEKLPALVTVDGEDFANLNLANEALDGGKNLDISLERTSALGGVTVASTGTITHHEIKNFSVATGYLTNDKGDVIEITLDESTGHVIISINGVVVLEDDLRYGTDLAELLESFGSYGTAVVAGNGSIFTNVSWQSDAPGVVTGDAEYDGTGTEHGELYYAHADGVAIGGLTYDEAGLLSIMTNSTPCSIILNKSATVTSGSGIGKNKNIYLNNNSLSFSGGNHAMSVGGSANSMNFYGPGTINDLNSSNTQAFLFAGYGWTGKVTINNLTLNTNQSVFQLRSGNAEINNCKIYAFAAYDGPLFQVGEDYNGNYSTTPITLNINDSYINFRVSNTRTVQPITMLRQVCVSSAADPYHVVNIDGSTIIAEHSFFQANSTISGTNATESNMTINVKDSKLVSDSLVLTKNGNTEVGFFATLNFLDNVSVNSNMQNLAYADLADGLVEVKSNDHSADITYASKYATVTWANGTVEHWANGSVPVNSAVPFTVVTPVKSGVSYTFDQVYGEAPFALSGNLTLGSFIAFNLYVPNGTDLKSVVVNGKTIKGEEKAIGQDIFVCYKIVLDPIDASTAFDVIFTLATDEIVTHTMSVANYASLVYDKYGSDVNTVNMMSATLDYIVSSNKYFGIKVNVSAITELLSAHPAVEVADPTTHNTDTSALSSYITSAQLNIMSTLKFRFNLVSGVSGSDVKVSVGGVQKDVEVGAGYVEVALRAYEMGDTMTITVGDATGTFDLAYYIIYANGVYATAAEQVAASSSYFGTGLRPLEESIFYSMINPGSGTRDKGGLLNAIYSYYIAASNYKA